MLCSFQAGLIYQFGVTLENIVNWHDYFTFVLALCLVYSTPSALFLSPSSFSLFRCPLFLSLPSFHSSNKILHSAYISHANKVMLKILQARLQKYMKWELTVVQAGFRKGRKTRDQTANIYWITEKAREFQKKHLLLLHWLHESLWSCGSQQTVENS